MLLQFGSFIVLAQGVQISHREIPYVGNNIPDWLMRPGHDCKLIYTLPSRVLTIPLRIPVIFKITVIISLALKCISLVSDLLDDGLRLDGSLSLSIALRSAEVAQEKRDQICNNRFEQSSTKNTRKAKHELCLQTAVHTPRKSKIKLKSKPNN